jgi:hypothetical protein
MKVRELAFAICLIAFVLALALVVGYVSALPQNQAQYLPSWFYPALAFYFLVGLCGVAIAYWVDEDKENLENLEKRIEDLEKKTS